ncbi:DUF4357 domain-containing protein [Acidaminococcus fermentans]|uniref:DUF4357 domain-containing protein n=2 Tax=Acidaminococcus fermentans TaxID=905 RepID=UPI003F8C768B
MKSVNLYLAEETIDGALSMSSTLSKVTVTRLEKENVASDKDGLNGPGIYFLLAGTNKIYVGETGLDILKNRVLNKHTGDIDKLWHTVIGFKILDNTISNNELYYLENAMCEYVYDHPEYECLTTNPSKATCNAFYRDKHYKLSAAQIDTCKTYLKDIQFYLTLMPGSLFPKQPPQPSDVMLFQYENKKREVNGTAEIQVHVEPGKKRKITVKAGSTLSVDVSLNFSAGSSIQKKRIELAGKGKIKDRILLEDVDFTSPTAAVEFLAGISLSGNACWKSVKEHKSLKDLLK